MKSATATKMSPAAVQAEYYRVQMDESKLSWILVFVGIFLAIFTIATVMISIYTSYHDFITDPRIGTMFGYMCCLGHVYPFMAGMFFKNPNTPDIVINVYYYLYQQGAAWGTGPYAVASPNQMQALVVPDNWRDAVNSIVWYSESNYTLGYSDILTWAQSSAVGILATPPESTSAKLTSLLATYGVPALNIAVMIACAALA